MRIDARALIVAAAALVVVAVTARLGLWQLDRAGQKLALQARIEAQAARAPVTVGDLRVPVDTGDLPGRTARLEGRWVPGRILYLDNRQMGGRPGFYVLGAFRPDGLEDALLVQRGWVPRDPQDRLRVPPVEPAPGRWILEGRMAPPPARLFELGAEAQGPIRQNVQLSELVAQWQLPLLPVMLVQTRPEQGAEGETTPAPIDGAAAASAGAPGAMASASPGAASEAPDPAGASRAVGASLPGALARDWPQPAVDVHKHHGYAFQWFALSALTTGLYVWFQLIRPRRRRQPPAP